MPQEPTEPDSPIDHRGRAEAELTLARTALDADEADGAARHLAQALAWSPALPEVHELLARLGARTRGGLNLYPMEGEVFVGALAARAHLLAAAGYHADALDLLVLAQRHAPAEPWADVAWLTDPELTDRIPAERLAIQLMTLVRTLPDPIPEPARPPFLPYLNLVRRALVGAPGQPVLLWVGSSLARRLGASEEAIDWARRSERSEPSPQAAVALGYAYRNLGNWREAESALHRAVRYDPDDLDLRVDVAELYARTDRLEEAESWLEQVLAKNQAHPSGFPTACAVRFLRTRHVDHLVALADHLRANPGSAHAEALLASYARTRYWLGPVPHPDEAIVNLLDKLLASEQPLVAGRVSLSALEPPSAVLAFNRALPDFEVDVESVPAPDLREPLRPVEFALWRYEGMRALPAVPEPDQATIDTVAALAGRDWRHPLSGYDEAVRLAGLDLPELLGVLVHPCPPPDPTLGWPVWIRRLQAWTCLGILHYRTDEPWLLSTRRQVLFDLVEGVEDWTGEAALFALIAYAWVDPEARSDVRALVERRMRAAADAYAEREVTLLDSLTRLVLATPGVDERLAHFAQELFQRRRAR